MPIAYLLVDTASSGHKIINFMEKNAGYNWIFMDEEDISKTTFRCRGAIGLYEWIVMTFVLRNVEATYQQTMNSIFHKLIDRIVKIIIEIVVRTSSRFNRNSRVHKETWFENDSK